MTEHECRHEVDLALLQKDTADIKDDVKEILSCLMGNGKIGLKTQVELLKQSRTRSWWVIGLIIVGTGVLKVLA